MSARALFRHPAAMLGFAALAAVFAASCQQPAPTHEQAMQPLPTTITPDHLPPPRMSEP